MEGFEFDGDYDVPASRPKAIVHSLTEPQTAIALSDKRFRIVVAGRRFGKSFLAYEEMFRLGTSEEATKKGGFNIWYVANTADNARRIMWKSYLMKEQYVPRAYVKKSNEQRMELTLKNGTTISVFSGEEPDSLRGSSIDFLIMDECAFLKEEAWTTIYPALTDKYCQGKALLISSPDGYNWFYELYSSALKGEDPDWEAFHYTTAEGGNVTADEIEKAKKKLSTKEFNKEFLASFENMADRIYENYDKEGNDAVMDEKWGQYDIHVGMDFNVNPMTAAIAVEEEDAVIGRSYTFFDEIVTKGTSNTREMCRLIKERYPKATVYVYPDPTGNKHQTSAPIGVTDMTILRDEGFIVCAPYAPYPSKDKWNTVNTALLNAAGERHVRVCRDRCPNLVKGLDGYSRKENGDPDKSTGLDHLTDAMAYLICYRLPLNGGRRIIKPRVFGV